MPAIESTAVTLTKAIEHHQRGELDKAEAIYRQILTRDANHSDALHLLGLIAHQSGRHAEAEQLIRRAIAATAAPVAAYHNSLGLAQWEQGHTADALQSFRTAHGLDPTVAEVASNLANTLRLAGQAGEAETLCRAGLARNPGSPDLHFVLGMTLRQRGRLDEAQESLQNALVLNPSAAEAHNALGLVYQELGQASQALGHFQRAISLRPSFAEARNNRGNCLSELGRLTEAEQSFRQALAIRPDLAETYANLGNTLQEMSRPKEAIAAYSEAYRLGKNFGARIRSVTTLPVIPASTEEIHDYRRRMEQGIDELLVYAARFYDPLKQTGGASFYSAYHGVNNSRLHSKLAQVYLRACPSLSWTAPHCASTRRREGRLRVGFISKFMHKHSIGKTTSGLIAGLARERFEVHALFVPPRIADETSTFIRERADHVTDLPPTLEDARKQIAALELDILFYQDIGMEPFTYFLAFARLAPVQCVSFGHPDTTGIPTVDYWVSSDLFEPPDAREHYSEQLVLLHNLGTLAYYYRPKPPEPLKPRAAFDLPANTHIYLCPQTLFKLHPDFDPLLGDILRTDPRGVVVLVEGKNPHWVDRLRARFARQIPDVTDRIRFVPSQKGADFLNLIAVSDVMLDTIHFNGMNTSLEAFAVGTPVVTLPGAFQRGRHTAGMYTRMGIRDCIAATAEEYVQVAVRLGTEPDFNRHVRRAILAQSGVLYEDANILREFERFFTEATAEALSRTAT